MWINTASFVAGVFICQQSAELPSIYWIFSGFVLAALLSHKQKAFWNLAISFALFGFCWASLSAHLAMQNRLVPELVKETLLITGKVIDLPVEHHQGWRFTFKPYRASLDGRKVDLPDKIRLGWYRGSTTNLMSGQTWQLKVRLKPPVGTLNPGIFDYETWLYQEGIGATGYVLNDDANLMLDKADWYAGFGFFREKLRTAIRQYTDYPESAALMAALTVGDKSGITQSMWESFRRSGINHLVAISGLHIGMIAVAAYWLAGFIWRRSATLCLLLPAPHVQSVAAIVTAFLYAGLAGFSIPTQRAMIMLMVVMLARLWLVNLAPTKQLSLAVFFVLLLDPVSILGPGFWLSFIAVVAIYLAIQDASALSKLSQLLRMQWSITLLILPLSLYWFGQVSLISPLVNLVLVPLFSVLIVPAALLLAVLNLFIYPLVGWPTELYLQLLENGLLILKTITSDARVSYTDTTVDSTKLLILLLPAVLWHLPWKRLSQSVSVLVLLFVLLIPGKHPVSENLKLTLLDVGQGLSVFIQQGSNTLLYDLGPRYGISGSATESIVIPYLKKQGIKHIDKLVVSHFDSDHAGDVQALIDEISVSEILSGEKTGLNVQVKPCVAGDHWQWSGTVFNILSPDRNDYQGNNASCVIRISIGQSDILLTGDIERKMEKYLLETQADKLASSIIIVPHHGSRSSSMQSFVNTVNPEIVLNSSGYLNRYRFPDKKVKQRWLETGSYFLDTAIQGAVELELDKQGEVVTLSASRQDFQKYWYWQRY